MVLTGRGKRGDTFASKKRVRSNQRRGLSLFGCLHKRGSLGGKEATGGRTRGKTFDSKTLSSAEDSQKARVTVVEQSGTGVLGAQIEFTPKKKASVRGAPSLGLVQLEGV